MAMNWPLSLISPNFVSFVLRGHLGPDVDPPPSKSVDTWMPGLTRPTPEPNPSTYREMGAHLWKIRLLRTPDFAQRYLEVISLLELPRLILCVFVSLQIFRLALSLRGNSVLVANLSTCPLALRKFCCVRKSFDLPLRCAEILIPRPEVSS